MSPLAVATAVAPVPIPAGNATAPGTGAVAGSEGFGAVLVRALTVPPAPATDPGQDGPQPDTASTTGADPQEQTNGGTSAYLQAASTVPFPSSPEGSPMPIPAASTGTGAGTPAFTGTAAGMPAPPGTGAPSTPRITAEPADKGSDDGNGIQEAAPESAPAASPAPPAAIPQPAYTQASALAAPATVAAPAPQANAPAAAPSPAGVLSPVGAVSPGGAVPAGGAVPVVVSAAPDASPETGMMAGGRSSGIGGAPQRGSGTAPAASPGPAAAGAQNPASVLYPGAGNGMSSAAPVDMLAAPAPPSVSAPVVAPAPVPVPAGFAGQLNGPVFSLAAAGKGEHIMTVAVNPEHLGPVTVQAHIGNSGIRLELFAGTADGREVLRQILPDLKRDLAEAGVHASLDLSAGNQPGGGRDGNDQRLPRPRTIAYADGTDSRQLPLTHQSSGTGRGLHSPDGSLDVIA